MALPAVYTLTNDSAGNRVAAYTRATNGNLTRRGSFPTNGNGLGAGLGSQGALVFQLSTNRFFAVNAGDNTISMLSLSPDGTLMPLATVPSGGVRPISITVSGNTVYVVNEGDRAGVAANITGFLYSLAGGPHTLSIFQVNADGSLTAMPALTGLPLRAAGLVAR